MKVAAYQAPLLEAGSMDALDSIRARVAQCEAEGISLLCCPEAILGGLADYSPDPTPFAIATSRIGSVLAPLASRTVTTIVGLTELGDDGALYNSAAVFHRGAIVNGDTCLIRRAGSSFPRRRAVKGSGARLFLHAKH